MIFVRTWLLTLSFTIAAGDARAQQLVNAYPNLTFTKPIYLTSCGDTTDRVFVAQQNGMVKLFANDSLVTSAKTFLDISNKLSSSSGEEGLLGLAFHPDYSKNGYLFVNYTAPAPLRTVVSRYRVHASDPDRADSLSEYKIIEILQPFANHNGGMLAFGPDGYLYIGVGDGGSAGDPQNNAQNRTTLLGKILRIDVNDTTATTHYVIPPDNPYANDPGSLRKEIWAYGLRNPWRFSFDSATGTLWAGDVGQNTVEEIDVIEKGKNYGWRIMEGTHCYNPPTGCDTTGLTLPVKEYLHTEGQSITGGYVYRGYRRPELADAYVCGDYVARKIWVLRYESGHVTVDSLLTTMPNFVSSFGTDRYQELYILTYSSTVNTGIYRFAGKPRVATLLQSYHTEIEGASISVIWELSEADKRMDFSVLRAEMPGGEFREIPDAAIVREHMIFTFRDITCERGATYRYRIEVSNESGRRVLLETDAVAVPALELSLSQNFPNPFNPSTTITFDMKQKGIVTLRVYDVAGRLVRTLFNGVKDAGSHSIPWDGMNDQGTPVASGIYFYEMETRGFSAARKMVVLP